MFTVVVETQFLAIHQLRLPGGIMEPLHGHDWRVQVSFRRPHLDDLGMVVDFDLARQRLESVVKPLRYANLSDLPALRGLNATAEVVAKYIFDGLVEARTESVWRVAITEAPGCVAVFENGDPQEIERRPAN